MCEAITLTEFIHGENFTMENFISILRCYKHYCAHSLTHLVGNGKFDSVMYVTEFTGSYSTEICQ